MRHILLLLAFITCLGTNSLNAQSIFWSDTFDAPAGGGNNNNAGAGWSLNSGGFGGNQWYINGSNTNCQGANMLHISCSSFICLLQGATSAALYDASDASDRSAISPTISTIGQTNMEMRFFWISVGEGSDDYGMLSFSADNGTTWEDYSMLFDGHGEGAGGSSASCHYGHCANF